MIQWIALGVSALALLVAVWSRIPDSWWWPEDWTEQDKKAMKGCYVVTFFMAIWILFYCYALIFYLPGWLMLANLLSGLAFVVAIGRNS